MPWKMKGNWHSESGSAPDIVEQVEVLELEGGGGVGPEIEQVGKLMYMEGLCANTVFFCKIRKNI